ncbi:hypothetical protein VPH35_006008 [Triticum aestivum]|uniref:replication protein A 70 kDa DNA-binding subunit E n=1 Tax=Triticum aestivum TaxID=4565 RepID=UPI001D02473D|nr:replication protein A 70 kDa DNA-binding subunit E-like [Triticum aestivum]
MGGGMAADLTHGAVAALVSGLGQVMGAVLQVVGAPGPAPAGTVAGTGQFGLVLSDGVHSLEAVLDVTMDGLVTAGLLRAGSVVRVLDYLYSYAANLRVFVVFQLEILQAECTLIGSPTIYEVSDPKNGCYSDRLGIHRPDMISKVQQGVTNIACSRDQGLAGSSRAPRVEHAVNNLRGFYDLVSAQNTIDAKMQQLSLRNQGQGLAAPPTNWEGFDCTGNTYRTIAQIKDENFRMSSQPDLITVVAAVSQVDSGAFCYPSCALMFDGEKCNNKLKVDGDGWWCTRCLWRSQTCEYRYMLNCQISDHTGSTNATVLQQAAEEIIGYTAQELLMIKDVEKDGVKFEEIMQGILGRQCVLKLRVEGHGVMTKRSIVEAEKLESPNTSHLLGAIGNLLKSGSSPTPWQQGGLAPTARRPTNLQAPFRTSNNSYGSMRSTRGASYGRPADQLPRFSTPPPPYSSMMSTGGASYLRSLAGQLPHISTPPSAYGSMMSTGGATYRHMAYRLPQILSTPPSAYGSMMSTGGDASYWY